MGLFGGPGSVQGSPSMTVEEAKGSCSVLGSVWVVDCLEADQHWAARTFVMTSNNYQITACTCVRYGASYQLFTVVYLVPGSV